MAANGTYVGVVVGEGGAVGTTHGLNSGGGGGNASKSFFFFPMVIWRRALVGMGVEVSVVWAMAGTMSDAF
jgi:hypothetical protein